MISEIKRVLVALRLLVVSVSSYISAPVQGGVFASLLCRVASTLLTSGLVVSIVSCRIVAVFCVFPVLCVACSRRRRGRDFLVVPSLMMMIHSPHLFFCPWSNLIDSARWFHLFDPLPFTHLPSRRDIFSHLSSTRPACLLASTLSNPLTHAESPTSYPCGFVFSIFICKQYLAIKRSLSHVP